MGVDYPTLYPHLVNRTLEFPFQCDLWTQAATDAEIVFPWSKSPIPIIPFSRMLLMRFTITKITPHINHRHLLNLFFNWRKIALQWLYWSLLNNNAYQPQLYTYNHRLLKNEHFSASAWQNCLSPTGRHNTPPKSPVIFAGAQPYMSVFHTTSQHQSESEEFKPTS